MKHRRISTDYDDASQMHSYSQHPPNAMIFFDSKGRPHDSEFAANIFPTPTPNTKRKARASFQQLHVQTANTNYYNEDSEDDEDIFSSPIIRHHNEEDMMNDPFRSRRSSPTPASTSSATFNVAYKPQSTRLTPLSATSCCSYSTTPSSFNTTPIVNTSTSFESDDEPPLSAPAASSYSSSTPSASSKRTKAVLKRRPPPAMIFEEDDDEVVVARAGGGDDDEDEDVPTCGEALKRKFTEVVSNFKLSVHRAKRRVIPREKSAPLLDEKSVYVR